MVKEGVWFKGEEHYVEVMSSENLLINNVTNIGLVVCVCVCVCMCVCVCVCLLTSYRAHL